MARVFDADEGLGVSDTVISSYRIEHRTSHLYPRTSFNADMSLFGTSPEATPQRNLKSSLFDDEPATTRSGAGRQGGSSLFAAEGPDENESSPWGFPTPWRAARSNPVKTLLAGADVPESYIDAYDALLEAGESASNGVSLSGVRRMLSGCNISSAAQSQILKIVGEDQAGLGRPEFNVVLACVGLAQEGEDISLDGVDERRRSKTRFGCRAYTRLADDVQDYHNPNYHSYVSNVVKLLLLKQRKLGNHLHLKNSQKIKASVITATNQIRGVLWHRNLLQIPHRNMA